MEVEERLAYLAGFFDGEGCITVNANGGITLRVINTSKPVLDLFKEILGGSIGDRTQKVNKRQYAWSAYGNTAYKILHALYPYLIEKQDQADLALEWFNERVQYPRQKIDGRGWAAHPLRDEAIKSVRQQLTDMKMGVYAA